jgi:hypothetical protein
VPGAFNTIRPSVFARRMIKIGARIRLRAGVVALTFMLALMSAPAHAQQQFYVFKSLLSAGSANWCMDNPGGVYQPGAQITVSGCTAAPSQTLGYENGTNLTLGGLCLDGQLPSAGGAVVIAECDGSDHQVWVLQPFQNNRDVFEIVNPDGLCVSVNGAIGQRMPLVLAPCEERPAQGWVSYSRPSGARPVYGTYSEPQYYWRSGQRYCWYDNGWNGAGWYVCGSAFLQGEGYGGPLGWSYWYFPGQIIPTIRPTLRPTIRPTTLPTIRPTILPTVRPTVLPTVRPTLLPTVRPTIRPTLLPTVRPTVLPTVRPTIRPTLAPTVSPTVRPTVLPTVRPTIRPTLVPTVSPTVRPTVLPTVRPTIRPTLVPTVSPTVRPTVRPTLLPTVAPSDIELKHDVVKLGSLASGIGIYRFQYNWSDQVYVGVIAQEVTAVRPDAVLRGPDGYLRVDYRRLGVRFQTWNQWVAAGGQTGN